VASLSSTCRSGDRGEDDEIVLSADEQVRRAIERVFVLGVVLALRVRSLGS
jgi:hypothetical protein